MTVRTVLAIDDDVLTAAKAIADQTKRSCICSTKMNLTRCFHGD